MGIRLRNGFLITLLVVLVSSCSHHREPSVVRSVRDQEEASGQIQSNSGAVLPSGAAEPGVVSRPVQGPTEPESSRLRLEHVVLVTGPGAWRSAALIGLLREFEQKKIKIKGLISSELSAFMAVLYQRRKLQGLHWYFSKFLPETWFHFPIISIFNEGASLNELTKYLKASFQGASSEGVPVFVWGGFLRSQQMQWELFNKDDALEDLSRRIQPLLIVEDLHESTQGASKDSPVGNLEMPISDEQAKSLIGPSETDAEIIHVDFVSMCFPKKDQDIKDREEETLVRHYWRYAQNLNSIKPRLKNLIQIPCKSSSFLNVKKTGEYIFLGRQSAHNFLQSRGL